MLPPAPARFSITNGCLSNSSIFLVRMRASTSLGPPGANPMISVIGWRGKSAGTGTGPRRGRAPANAMTRFIVVSFSSGAERAGLLPRRGADRHRPHRRAGRALGPQRQDDGAGEPDLVPRERAE